VVYALDVHWATRVWWLLRANGFDNVAVLDGGLRKWTAEGRPTRTGVEINPEAKFVGQPRSRLFAELDEVKRVVDTGSGACLINSPSPQDHHAVETNYFARPGRITRPTVHTSRSASSARSSPTCCLGRVARSPTAVSGSRPLVTRSH
jgi:thiosulfate/3-mercaptopyruvate sulfurtransferase